MLFAKLNNNLFPYYFKLNDEKAVIGPPFLTFIIVENDQNENNDKLDNIIPLVSSNILNLYDENGNNMSENKKALHSFLNQQTSSQLYIPLTERTRELSKLTFKNTLKIEQTNNGFIANIPNKPISNYHSFISVMKGLSEIHKRGLILGEPGFAYNGKICHLHAEFVLWLDNDNNYIRKRLSEKIEDKYFKTDLLRCFKIVCTEDILRQTFNIFPEELEKVKSICKKYVKDVTADYPADIVLKLFTT